MNIPALVDLVISAVILAGGVSLLRGIGQSDTIRSQVSRELPRLEQRPLDSRFGYSTAAVERYWGALDANGLAAEKRGLTWDLLFPPIYGGALAFSVQLTLGNGSPRPSSLAPFDVCLILADSAEDLILIAEQERFRRGDSLQVRLVSIASASTRVKIVLLGSALTPLVVVGSYTLFS